MHLLETLIAVDERVVVPVAVFVRGIEKEYPREISLHGQRDGADKRSHKRNGYYASHGPTNIWSPLDLRKRLVISGIAFLFTEIGRDEPSAP